MPLVNTTLKDDLIAAYKSMTDGNNKVFSQKISAAVKKFAESGDIATVDKGGVSAGAFVGAGKGKITLDDSICEKIIYAACNAMDGMKSGGNNYLAAEMASGIHAMVSAGEVKTDVSGTVTTPSGASVSLSGNAMGKMTGVPAPMQTAFTTTFNSMDAMKTGGDEYKATQISIAVDAYLKAAVVNTNGSAALSGSASTGAMT